MRPPLYVLLACALILPPGGRASAAAQSAAERPDKLVEDFEGQTYGRWKTNGEAFGDGPARGALPGQMPVSGYLGQGLVNSFRGGDDATGTLTSPPFRLERSYLNFLIGGGGFGGETCVNLLVGGKVVRTATGKNTDPGGTERLRWRAWDIRELAGKEATLEIVDRRKGGWGHINVDQIVQSDQSRQAPSARREIALTQRYLHLPVRTGAARERMRIIVQGNTVREFDIEVSDGRTDFWVFTDLKPYIGKTVLVEVDDLEAGAPGFAAIVQRDEIPDAAGIYREARRPQFHFTSRRGWLNDPNGLVWKAGLYHLFYQHNPYGWNWGNMHWGHAVSPDLVHWKELPTALYPRQYGDWCWSGSAVVDVDNSSGFQRGSRPPLVLAYTSTGRGECIAYSNDEGLTWTEYEGNPVVKHVGRDPKLVRFARGKTWVMAVYEEAEGRQSIVFHTSTDLKHWTRQSRIDGFFECPDLFELPVDGDPGRTRWVLHAADGKYVLGDFDGREFHVASGKDKLQVWYGKFYAAQSFSDTPDARRIQIGWASGVTFPGMPFNQQMALPVELTLRTADGGVRMFAEPVKELASLRVAKHEWSNLKLADRRELLAKPEADLLEVEADFSPPEKGIFEIVLHGIPLTYDASLRELSCQGVKAPLEPQKGRVRLRAYLDRGSVEAFGNLGRVALSAAAQPDAAAPAVSVSGRGGPVTVHSLVVHELRSAWDSP